MYRDDLIKQWLWMQAAAYALEHIAWACKNLAVPSEDDRRIQPWAETLRITYEYALAHWDKIQKPIYSGSFSGHCRYDLGRDVEIKNQTVTATYRTTEVTLTMNEIRRLIEHMLKAPEMEERQITMFDMLVEQVPQTL